MGLVVGDDGWRIRGPGVGADGAASAGAALAPVGLLLYWPRVPDRDAMNAILLVLRTGMQWNALNATGICCSSSAHRRFREWEQAGVFHEIWRQGLLDYDTEHGIEWEWLALDGAIGKAPLGGELTGPNPTDRAKRGETFAPQRGQGRPAWAGAGGREPPRLEAHPSPDRHGPDPATSADHRSRRPSASTAATPTRGSTSSPPSALSPPTSAAAPRRRGLKRQAGWRARRWVVEPTHSWLNRFRRILTRWGETRRHLPRDAPPRLRPHHLARAADREPQSE